LFLGWYLVFSADFSSSSSSCFDPFFDLFNFRHLFVPFFHLLLLSAHWQHFFLHIPVFVFKTAGIIAFLFFTFVSSRSRPKPWLFTIALVTKGDSNSKNWFCMVYSSQNSICSYLCNQYVNDSFRWVSGAWFCYSTDALWYCKHNKLSLHLSTMILLSPIIIFNLTTDDFVFLMSSNPLGFYYSFHGDMGSPFNASQRSFVIRNCYYYKSNLWCCHPWVRFCK